MQTTSFEIVIQALNNPDKAIPELSCVDLILIKDFVTLEQKTMLEHRLKSIQDTAIKYLNNPISSKDTRIKSITIFFKILELETALNSNFSL